MRGFRFYRVNMRQSTIKMLLKYIIPIHMSVNAEVRQDATLHELIWKIDEIICHLSGFYHLRPGDVILTGTPAGVGPVGAGDEIEGGIDGLEPIHLTLTGAE